jgi:hypothetical protein
VCRAVFAQQGTENLVTKLCSIRRGTNNSENFAAEEILHGDSCASSHSKMRLLSQILNMAAPTRAFGKTGWVVSTVCMAALYALFDDNMC